MESLRSIDCLSSSLSYTLINSELKIGYKSKFSYRNTIQTAGLQNRTTSETISMNKLKFERLNLNGNK